MTIRKALMITFFLSVGGPSTASQDEDCWFDAETAGVFMGHRQEGLWSLAKMMDAFGSEPGLRAMVLAAYEKPRMNTSEMRQFMIDEFANEWAVRCYTSGSVFDPDWAG